MLICSMCGGENADDAFVCAHCPNVFRKADHHIEGPAGVPNQRPTGIGPMIFGYVFLLVAGLLFFLSLGAGPSLRAVVMHTGAGAAFSLFLILWSVGYIVRAISFLPGKD